jgi:hypothetical protein
MVEGAEYPEVLKTRNLLIFRGAQNAASPAFLIFLKVASFNFLEGIPE